MEFKFHHIFVMLRVDSNLLLPEQHLKQVDRGIWEEFFIKIKNVLFLTGIVNKSLSIYTITAIEYLYLYKRGVS